MKLYFSLLLLVAVLTACSDDNPGAGATADADGSDAGADAAADAGADSDATGGDAVGDSAPDTRLPDSSDDAPLPQEPPESIGDDRPAAVVAPEDWADRRDWPLIVLLHGYTATAALQDFYFSLSQRVDELGFVLLLPNGTVDQIGNPFWNATDACCDSFGADVDDQGYLSDLIDEALIPLRIDPGRVYLVGHSNGAFMAYRMACDSADQITAIAGLAGATFIDQADCEPSRPVSILHIHGTLDGTIAYGGGVLGINSFPGARASALQWRDHNGCDEESTEAANRDYDTAILGAETTPESWTGCQDDTDVTLWTMTGSSHIPSINNDFKDDMVEYLLDHRRVD